MDRKEAKLKRGQLYWLILEVIGVSLVAGGGHPLRPTLFIAIEAIAKILKEIKKLDVEEKKIKKTLRVMEKKEILDIVYENEKVHVFVKDGGNKSILRYSIKTLLNFKRKEKKWRGKWYLVFFDVPEIQRNKRDYLRSFITKLGFFRYQKSVYVFPYECEYEIALIKRIVEGAKYMRYVVAEKIEDEERIKTYFRLD